MGNDALLRLNPVHTPTLFGKVPRVLVQKCAKEHCNSIGNRVTMPGTLLLGSWVTNESCLQKLLLEKAGAPGSRPGRNKQGNYSAHFDFAVAHSGMSGSKVSGLSRLSSPSTAGASHHTCCCCRADMKLVNNRSLIFFTRTETVHRVDKSVYGEVYDVVQP